MKSILFYLWQLPQNIAGLVLLLYFRLKGKVTEGIYKDVNVYFASVMQEGGVSLGRYIFFDSASPTTEKDLAHEYGHCLQSRYLGWLYLLVIGLPSAIHKLFHHDDWSRPNSYYRFYTERWADRLGGVKR